MFEEQLRALRRGQNSQSVFRINGVVTDMRESKVIHHGALVPPQRRARVAFAVIFFCLSLSLLNYVSML